MHEGGTGDGRRVEKRDPQVHPKVADGQGAKMEPARQEAGRRQVLANEHTVLADWVRELIFREELAAIVEKTLVVDQARVTWADGRRGTILEWWRSEMLRVRRQTRQPTESKACYRNIVNLVQGRGLDGKDMIRRRSGRCKIH